MTLSQLMRAVFASGTPSFGSCAGLQVAVAAAGGRTRPMPRRIEAGLSRRIVPTAAGPDHPLLAGNAVTRAQAVEIRHDKGVFWAVQYHPELALGEIAAALRQAADLVSTDLAPDEAAVAA